MTRRLLSSPPVEKNTEPVSPAALVEPPRGLDARIRQLAHAALLEADPAPRVARWEVAFNAILVTSYATYVVSQVLRIFAGNHG